MAVACSGCGSSGAAVHRPRPVPSGAATDDPQARSSDDRLGAFEALRAKLDELLADVEKRLLAEAVRPSPAEPEEPPPAAAAQRAPDPVAEAADHRPGELDARIQELLERRLIITVALARVIRATLQRRIELGLDVTDGSADASTPLLAAARHGSAAGEGSGIDLAHASVAAVLQDAELALDEVRRWRASDHSVVRGRAKTLELGLLDDPAAGDGGELDGRFEFGAGAGIDQPIEDSFDDDRERSKKREARAGPRYLEERRGDEPTTGEGSDDDLPAEPRKVAAPKRKAAPPGLAKGGGWFGMDEKPDADASRRASVVVQGAPPAGVMPAVQRRLGTMLECIPATIRAEGPIRFRVTARFGGDGQLHEALIRSATPLPPTVDACLVDQLARVRAPAPQDGASRMVSFPVWLSGE